MYLFECATPLEVIALFLEDRNFQLQFQLAESDSKYDKATRLVCLMYGKVTAEYEVIR